MKLWLLRHAQVLVPPGVCYGASEVQVDLAATQAAAELFAECPAPGCTVWTSPAERTQLLAAALLSRRNDLQGPHVDARLREMDFGQWELKPWSDIPRQAVNDWTDDFVRHRFGGNESTQEVIDRVAQAMDSAVAQAVSEMVWITHAGVIRAVQFLVEGGLRPIQSASDWPVSAPAMGTWMCIQVTPPHAPSH